MKLSIVIPIYNAMPFLVNTLDCITNQKSDELQIILVNDGSTDDSKDICEKYKQKDRRIIFINNEHKGVSEARNCGIDRAAGNYIWFADADDLIPSGIVERIIEFISRCSRKPDIIFSDYITFTKESQSRDSFVEFESNKISKSNSGQLIRYLRYDKISCITGSQIYKTKFIKGNNIFFDRNLIVFEEIDFLIKAILKQKKSDAFIPYIYEYRLDNKNAITKQDVNLNMFSSGCKMISKWLYYFQTENKDSIYDCILEQYSQFYDTIGGYIIYLPEKERSLAVNIYKKYQQLNTYAFQQ